MRKSESDVGAVSLAACRVSSTNSDSAALRTATGLPSALPPPKGTDPGRFFFSHRVRFTIRTECGQTATDHVGNSHLVSTTAGAISRRSKRTAWRHGRFAANAMVIQVFRICCVLCIAGSLPNFCITVRIPVPPTGISMARRQPSRIR